MSAQIAQRRAVSRRGATIRAAGGLPALAPYFFWVPYAVIALRPGPELTVPPALAWVGLALSVIGVAVSLWAIVTLGRHYDLVLEVHADHELIRGGPYALVRHPVYTGLALHFAGLCLATGNLLLIAGTLLVSYPAFYLRASAEERLLREWFGAEYEKYAREVPMLVPLP
ncbi:MAG TPA: isoprenylcysteine carboxylmethyltransferase family protein [Candidatus Limnocylindria bacterium]|nr:isoprenylcysteine carboxylmethyltransferase family protein [Candidatus Limnocylindria bacterium]